MLEMRNFKFTVFLSAQTPKELTKDELISLKMFHHTQSFEEFFCWYLCADITQDLDANYMISLQQHERVYLLRSSVNISILQKQKEGV